MKRLLASSLAALVALPVLAEAAPPPPAPPVSITLGARHGHVTPNRCGCAHTGGGNIDVVQPSPDIVVITMSGVAVATGSPCGASTASMDFDLEQCFEVNFDDPRVKRAKLTVEARVIGLLRSHCKGSGCAGFDHACATVHCAGVETVTLCLEPHSVCSGENLSVNDRAGPVSVPITAGSYTLRQTFSICATYGKSILPVKAASAEFAPDPALDPLWISYKEPFHGAAKKDFGFQITITVAPDTGPEPKTPEPAPSPDGKPNGKPVTLPPR
ncbi:MAG TPA: hypothetical protein VNK04_18455 [Gemmataceae bacterium]|nr:hypothetical protein [Gemmataceae bacterium]